MELRHGMNAETLQMSFFLPENFSSQTSSEKTNAFRTLMVYIFYIFQNN
jgi:hypothetical protein